MWIPGKKAQSSGVVVNVDGLIKKNGHSLNRREPRQEACSFVRGLHQFMETTHYEGRPANPVSMAPSPGSQNNNCLPGTTIGLLTDYITTDSIIMLIPILSPF